VVALPDGAALLPQETQLRARLDAFGHHADVQALPHRDDGADDAGIVGLGRDVANE
jgi:hypothetical protein